MPILSFLNGLENILVDSESKCSSKNSQGSIGNHANEWEEGQSEQDDKGCAENNSRFLGISPIHQFAHYN